MLNINSVKKLILLMTLIHWVRTLMHQIVKPSSSGSVFLGLLDHGNGGITVLLHTSNYLPLQKCPVHVSCITKTLPRQLQISQNL